MKSLFDQIPIRNNILKNRFIRSATWLALASDEGQISEEFIKVHRNLCDGGIGAMVLEFMRINKDDMPFEKMPSISDDSFIEKYLPLTSYARERGVAIFAQIGEGAYNVKTDKTILERDVNSATIPEIKAMVKEFALAAKRSQLAGFDGVQIHAAHGFLLSRFLSGAFNSRRDRYGKTLESRVSIILEILGSIRNLCSSNFSVGIKINSSSLGQSEEDGLHICKILDSEKIDWIEVSGENPSRKSIKPRTDESYFRHFAMKLASDIKTPIALVGGNRSLESMNEILNSSNIAYFSLSRPLIREANLVNRWKLGDKSPSRCISCNACFNTHGHECIFNMQTKQKTLKRECALT